MVLSQTQLMLINTLLCALHFVAIKRNRTLDVC
jgi:hypothetical protein